MKKKFSTHFVLLLSVFAVVSCGMGEEEAAPLSPYAYIKSFSIGGIRCSYHSFTSEGKDTTIVKTMDFSTVGFTIDQHAGRIYNNDSLLFGTDVSKVAIGMSVEGVPAIYVDSTETYVSAYSSDSIDFTVPRKMRVYSSDAQYFKDYTVSVNVHQVDPEMMVWTKYPAVENVLPVRALEHDGEMFLFGRTGDGTPVVAVTAEGDAAVWNVVEIKDIPAEALATVTLFDGKFYVVSAGNVYSSADAKSWDVVAAGTDAVAIVGASEEDGRLWIAGEQGILCSSDGISFTVSEPLPKGFPLYGISVASYPLSHNPGIIRYMVVGYASESADGSATVWSRLSSEDKWVCYDNEDNAFSCPDLNGLSVVRYNGYLYALGGAGVIDGNEIDAFSSFYVSKDNGIVWKENSSYYQRLPEELAGNNAPFAVTVDSKNYMWIINAGEDGGVWKGIINRLGFER